MEINYDAHLNLFLGDEIILGKLENLMYLSLSNASFFGEIPPHLSNLSRLIHLDLHYNRDLYPQNLDWVSSLSSLNFVSDCQLGSLLPSLPFVNFTSLLALDLWNNEFYSSIPQCLFNLSSLKKLDLGLSKLQGTIPYDFVNVRKLEHLDLHGNEKITGQLPSCFGNLCKLKTLYLSGNNFSSNIDGPLLCILITNKLIGKIPDSLGLFGSLRQLSLGYNIFGGSIPASIGKLSSLQLLHLSYKEMNGTIPKSIGQFSELVALLLDNNS
ncbi:receptor-like protein kinase 2 [Quercus suber]|uniref:Receptor-like protein kinase 2 n=1 Tax=Quercus suber TaxID=58331 RepID=A0AAW0L8X1_QUESU